MFQGHFDRDAAMPVAETAIPDALFEPLVQLAEISSVGSVHAALKHSLRSLNHSTSSLVTSQNPSSAEHTLGGAAESMVCNTRAQPRISPMKRRTLS